MRTENIKLSNVERQYLLCSSQLLEQYISSCRGEKDLNRNMIYFPDG